MELTDILPTDKWATLEQELQEYSGLNVHVYNKQGRYLTSYNAWANSLCPLIRSFPQGLTTICSIAQQNLVLQAQKARGPAVSECDAGLAKFVIPIYHGEEFLGSIGGCGRRFPGSEIEFFLISQVTGNSEQELQQNSLQIKEIQQEEINKIVQLFQDRLKEIMAGSG